MGSGRSIQSHHAPKWMLAYQQQGLSARSWLVLLLFQLCFEEVFVVGFLCGVYEPAPPRKPLVCIFIAYPKL